MIKKLTIIACLLLGVSLQLSAQKVWTDPVEYDDPTQEVTIYIDLTQMDCDKLVGSPGPLYLWSWMPAEPLVGNGAWSASNTDLEMTDEGNNVWSFTMTPTDFYGVSAQDVYDSDIFFLAKALDGGSGGDCSAAGDENKTEDLTLVIDPPGVAAQKVYSFPGKADGDSLFQSGNDVFTLLYDNALEDKASMQNPGDLYVYARAYDTDGNEYRPSTISQAGSNPDLMMSQEGTNYQWQIIPNHLFDIPADKTLDFMRLQIIKPVVSNSDDAVDGLWEYWLRCN
jgi:hypothetical protein